MDKLLILLVCFIHVSNKNPKILTLPSQRVAKFTATPMLVAAVLHFIALCAIIFYRPECANFSKQLRLQHLTPYLHMSCPIAIVSFFSVPIYLSPQYLDATTSRQHTAGFCCTSLYDNLKVPVCSYCMCWPWFFFTKQKRKKCTRKGNLLSSPESPQMCYQKYSRASTMELLCTWGELTSVCLKLTKYLPCQS